MTEKFDFFKRLQEMSVLPDQVTDACMGYYYNPNQFRVEMRLGKEIVCWFSIEALRSLAEAGEETLKSIICIAPHPKSEFMMDFFFPGWRLNHYIHTGKQYNGIV